MSVSEQVETGKYAIYNGDCIETMHSFPDKSVHLSLYSPPFGGLGNKSALWGDQLYENIDCPAMKIVM